jgi:hypothetical protein
MQLKAFIMCCFLVKQNNSNIVSISRAQLLDVKNYWQANTNVI